MLIHWDKIENGAFISEALALVAFAALIAYFVWESFKAKPEE